jgi:cytochrome c oxidase assembly factor CtaG
MTFAHAGHGHGDGTAALAPLLALVVLAAGYVVLAARQRGDRQPWSSWRTTSFLAGCTLLAFEPASPRLDEPNPV